MTKAIELVKDEKSDPSKILIKKLVIKPELMEERSYLMFDDLFIIRKDRKGHIVIKPTKKWRNLNE